MKIKFKKLDAIIVTTVLALALGGIATHAAWRVNTLYTSTLSMNKGATLSGASRQYNGVERMCINVYDGRVNGSYSTTGFGVIKLRTSGLWGDYAYGSHEITEPDPLLYWDNTDGAGSYKFWFYNAFDGKWTANTVQMYSEENVSEFDSAMRQALAAGRQVIKVTPSKNGETYLEKHPEIADQITENLYE